MSQDLFNNPLVNSAMKALTPEQKESYRIMGEHMFSVCKLEEKVIDPSFEIEQLLVYAKEGLKAGLHPNDMDKREIQVMYDIYGDDWYLEYGYEKSEVPTNALPKLERGGMLKVDPKRKKRTAKGKRRI